jgi:hypothetical protein
MIIKKHNGEEFIAIDGDDVGIRLRDSIVSNDIKGASLLSSAIIDYFALLRSMLETNGYQIVFCGGDSLLASSDHALSSSWFDGIPVGPCTISIGIGRTPEYAYLALQLAKARGKKQVVQINGTIADTVYKWNNKQN